MCAERHCVRLRAAAAVGLPPWLVCGWDPRPHHLCRWPLNRVPGHAGDWLVGPATDRTQDVGFIACACASNTSHRAPGLCLFGIRLRATCAVTVSGSGWAKHCEYHLLHSTHPVRAILALPSLLPLFPQLALLAVAAFCH